MTYQQANEYLGKKMNRPAGTGRHTRMVRNSGVPGDSIHLKLHNTYVITWYADGRIELNTGGWRTVTTKARINEFLGRETPWGVYQKNFEWFLSCSDASNPVQIVPFEDGVTIHSDGNLSYA